MGTEFENESKKLNDQGWNRKQNSIRNNQCK